ncbi:MAG TPA: hypothetical protein VGV86_17120 [Acidimicrobiales bacterium]|nr:hypothetical protein [Acidimicrobiales bacterium]
MSDAPDGPPDLAGGKERGDPGMEGASETGRSGVGHPDTGMDVDENSETNLQAEKGGSAGGGTG